MFLEEKNNNKSKKMNENRLKRAIQLGALIVILSSVLLANGQSTKSTSNRNQQSAQNSRKSPAYNYNKSQTGNEQQRQVQQREEQAQIYQSPRSNGSGQKRQQNQAQVNELPIQQQQQQQQHSDSQTDYSGGSTEDPLADSEPALYGSVAGSPGIDFPNYSTIPKTSFTCEGKGFDFGFYADEEAQCQVYHVCWSGRRESFLCGVGTVFNQAILACDYWHSVDCSKSSQFYGVNSELGKCLSFFPQKLIKLKL